MSWLTNFHDFGFKWTATAGIGIHPTKAWLLWISKMQPGREDTLEEWYAIKFGFKLEKNATETYVMLQTAFGVSCMNQAPVFEWHKRINEGRESVRDDERCGRSKEVWTLELIGQIKNFMDKDRRASIETIRAQFAQKSLETYWWHLVLSVLRKEGGRWHSSIEDSVDASMQILEEEGLL